MWISAHILCQREACAGCRILCAVVRQRRLRFAMRSKAWLSSCFGPHIPFFDGCGSCSCTLSNAATCILALLFNMALCQHAHGPQAAQRLVFLPNLQCRVCLSRTQPCLDFSATCKLMPTLQSTRHARAARLNVQLSAAPRAMPKPASSRYFLTWLYARMLTGHRQLSDSCNSLDSSLVLTSVRHVS